MNSKLLVDFIKTLWITSIWLKRSSHFCTWIKKTSNEQIVNKSLTLLYDSKPKITAKQFNLCLIKILNMGCFKMINMIYEYTMRLAWNEFITIDAMIWMINHYWLEISKDIIS